MFVYLLQIYWIATISIFLLAISNTVTFYRSKCNNKYKIILMLKLLPLQNQAAWVHDIMTQSVTLTDANCLGITYNYTD